MYSNGLLHDGESALLVMLHDTVTSEGKLTLLLGLVGGLCGKHSFYVSN